MNSTAIWTAETGSREIIESIRSSPRRIFYINPISDQNSKTLTNALRKFMPEQIADDPRQKIKSLEEGEFPCTSIVTRRIIIKMCFMSVCV